MIRRSQRFFKKKTKNFAALLQNKIMLFILILQMCKLRPGLHRGLSAKVSSLKMKVGEMRLSDLLFFCFCGCVGGFLYKMRDFPFVFLFCYVVR